MGASESMDHVEYLLRLREEVLEGMETAERELGALRIRVERMESDLRIGRPEAPEYAALKGTALPEAEARLVGLYRELLKLEDRINAARRKESQEGSASQPQRSRAAAQGRASIQPERE